MRPIVYNGVEGSPNLYRIPNGSTVMKENIGSAPSEGTLAECTNAKYVNIGTDGSLVFMVPISVVFTQVGTSESAINLTYGTKYTVTNLIWPAVDNGNGTGDRSYGPPLMQPMDGEIPLLVGTILTSSDNGDKYTVVAPGGWCGPKTMTFFAIITSNGEYNAPHYKMDSGTIVISTCAATLNTT